MDEKTAINLRFIITAPLELVWDALTNAETIEKWSGQEARMDDQPATQFALFGGDIYGRNNTVHPPQLLKQEFRDGHFFSPTIVTFKLFPNIGDTTSIEVIHEGVRYDLKESIIDGWHRYYFGPIQAYLGKTSPLSGL